MAAAALPQRTLNWLYSVLTRDHYDPNQTYQDPNRAYYDIANALAQYPSLSPRTDVYTFETGFSTLLLHITGTLPVSFRGTVYKFPIALWVPVTYPREPPIVYVTPTQDMVVRVGQHVTLEGRVYHHYLAHWAEAWDKSSILDFLSILRDVFAKEPPVRNKQQQQPMQRPPPQPDQVQPPPPRPPLPPELGSAMPAPPTTQSVAPPQAAVPAPPQPPPKPGQMMPTGHHQQEAPRAGRYDTPPPLPPLPPKGQDPRRQSFQSHAGADPTGRVAQYPQEIMSSLDGRGAYQNQPPPHIPPPVSTYTPGPVYSQGSSGTPVSPQQHVPPGPPQQPPQRMSYQQPSGPYPDYQQTQARGPYQPVPAHQPHPLQHPQFQQQPQQQQPPPTSRPAQPQPQPAAPDLLTSPFELELPSITSAAPAPPIPPNPEKFALLHAVSNTLTETLHSNTGHSEAASHSLLSQSYSLRTAASTLQSELSALSSLNATLQSNTSILTQSLHRADAVIADAQSRIAPPTTATSAAASSSSKDPGTVPPGLPAIDDVLVAPTVVGKQLYDLVAEESGIQAAIYALQTALVRGVIGVDTWSRHTRSLAREAFLKRALVRKIGRGMALEE